MSAVASIEQPCPQAFDDPHHRRLGQLGVLQERALAFAETMLAVAAVQTTNRLVLPHAFDHGKIPGIELVEPGTIGIGTGEH